MGSEVTESYLKIENDQRVIRFKLFIFWPTTSEIRTIFSSTIHQQNPKPIEKVQHANVDIGNYAVMRLSTKINCDMLSMWAGIRIKFISNRNE